MSDEEAILSDAAALGEGEVDFEAWADLSARMLKLDREARLDFLEEREIDPADFTRAEQRWVMALSDDLSAEKMDRVDLYAARCAAEMQRRKEAKPAPEPTMVVEELAPIKVLLPPAPAAVVSMPPVIRAPLHLSGTMMASEPVAGARPASAALPFGQAPSAEFVSEMSAPRVGAPQATVGGATLPLGVDLLGKMRKELPFLKAASSAPAPAAPPVAGGPRLPLDTYASLCAELSVFPERVPEILKKYGIADDAARRAVDREWAERLSAHPETQSLWQQKVAEFRVWLLRGGR